MGHFRVIRAAAFLVFFLRPTLGFAGWDVVADAISGSNHRQICSYDSLSNKICFEFESSETGRVELFALYQLANNFTGSIAPTLAPMFKIDDNEAHTINQGLAIEMMIGARVIPRHHTDKRVRWRIQVTNQPDDHEVWTTRKGAFRQLITGKMITVWTVLIGGSHIEASVSLDGLKVGLSEIAPFSFE